MRAAIDRLVVRTVLVSCALAGVVLWLDLARLGGVS